MLARKPDFVAALVFVALLGAMIALRLWGGWAQLSAKGVVLGVVCIWLGTTLLLGPNDEKHAARAR